MAEGKSLVGEKYTWFLGTKSDQPSFDATCCSDMRVLFFNPEQASSDGLRKMKRLGLSEEPLLESAFYADLTAKSLSAVSKMKKGGGLLPGKVQSNSSLFRRSLAGDLLHKVHPVLKCGAHCQRAGPDVRPEELRLGQHLGEDGPREERGESHHLPAQPSTPQGSGSQFGGKVP